MVPSMDLRAAKPDANRITGSGMTMAAWASMEAPMYLWTWDHHQQREKKHVMALLRLSRGIQAQ